MSSPVKDFYENLQVHIAKFIDDEEAATMVEYVILALGAAMILVVALPMLSRTVTGRTNSITLRMGSPLCKR